MTRFKLDQSDKHVRIYLLFYSLLVLIPENICSRSIFPTEKLGSHVSGVSLVGIIFPFPLLMLCTLLIEVKKKPKVPQLETARVSDENMFRLEVHMHKTIRVQVLQGWEEVTEVGPCCRLIWKGQFQKKVMSVLSRIWNFTRTIIKHYMFQRIMAAYTLLWQTWARRLVLSMEQQVGTTQLCLNVKSATFLPGCNKIHYVRVRTQLLMVPGFPDTPVPFAGTPEAMSRALHCVLAAIFFALHL